jgi:4-diphosphocytidyl-2-C-methyl-D-erythritol kinase
MNSIELKAKAKINLSLDVLRRRPDGYHDIKMIMQSISVHDRIVLEPIPKGIDIICDCRWVPSNSENIAYKAADLLFKQYDIKSGIRIKIEKNIPVAAGLAGGSSDAAAVLRGMRTLFDLNISEAELMSLGKCIGADVPFCLKGGTMLAEGIGEKLTGLVPLKKVDILLVKPKIGVSTAWVYKNLRIEEICERPNTDILISAIEKNNIDVVARNMKNVLETVTEKKHSIIREIKGKLMGLGALGSIMSGSGPTVFGIFPDKDVANKAFEAIKCDRWDCFLTETTDKEI